MWDITLVKIRHWSITTNSIKPNDKKVNRLATKDISNVSEEVEWRVGLERGWMAITVEQGKKVKSRGTTIN